MIFLTFQVGLPNPLDVVVKYEDERRTDSPENVREAAFEETICAFIFEDLSEAVEGTLVDSFLLANIHLHPSSDCVDGVGADS